MMAIGNSPANGDIWYFAYGSNLATDRMPERRELIRSARPGFVKELRLAFNKAGSRRRVYANLVFEPAGIVWGVVYLCNPDAMAKLDRAEGVMGRNYRRMPVRVETADGKVLDAETYVAGKRFITKLWRPSRAYLGLMVRGAKQHDLPWDYIQEIRATADEGGAGGMFVQRHSMLAV
jgi:gamma-glutamylcyclotransferase